MIRFLLGFVCLLVASSVTQAAGRKACSGTACQNPAIASSSYVIVEQAQVSKAAATPMPTGSYVPKAAASCPCVAATGSCPCAANAAAAPVSTGTTVSYGERRGLFNGGGLFHRRDGQSRCH